MWKSWNKPTWSDMNCLSALSSNICYRTKTQGVLRVFCLEMSYCNFQRRFPLQGAAEPGKKQKKNQSSGGWKCFSVHFLKSLHRKRLAEILCHHETVLEGWTEMFLEGVFHSRYMGQCVGLDFIWHYVQLLIKFHLEIDYLTLGFLFFVFFSKLESAARQYIALDHLSGLFFHYTSKSFLTVDGKCTSASVWFMVTTKSRQN